LARPVPLVPESIHLDKLLLEFQRNRVHLAMLLDEYGNVVGMVTLENVLEELVGPIQDEFDREPPRVQDLGGGVFELDATCPLDVLADQCGVTLPETEAETTGGLIVEQLGRLAEIGDVVTVDGHRLRVVKAAPTRVLRVRVEPVPRAAPQEPRGRERD
jgi:CBS domain containing-hemolysin-like protein